MSTKDIAILALCVAFAINATFTFRFQRTTLSICRALLSHNDPKLQAAMTPVWLGFLGWLHTALIFIVSALLWFYYGWLFGIAALSYSLIGTALIDFITPLPSYRFCFGLIEGELDRLIRKDITGEFVKFKEQVIAVKEKYRI